MQEQQREGFGIDRFYSGFGQVRTETHPDERVQNRRVAHILPLNHKPLLSEEHRQRTPVISFPDYIHPLTTMNTVSQADDNGRRSQHVHRSENDGRSGTRV